MLDVAFLIPVCNGEKTIKQAVESCINQNYPKENIFIYVINDGSTDNTKKIVQSIKFKNLVLINRENKGILTTVLELVKMCKQEWFAILEADDLYLSNFLEVMTKIHYKNPHKPMINGMSFQTIDDKNNITGTHFLKLVLNKFRLGPVWNRLINKFMFLEAFKDYKEQNYLNNYNDGFIMSKIHQFLNKKMPKTNIVTFKYREWESTSHISIWKEKHYLEWIKYFNLMNKYIKNKKLLYLYNFGGGVFEDKIFKLINAYSNNSITMQEYEKLKNILLPIFNKYPSFFNKKNYYRFLFPKIKKNAKLLALACEFYGFIPRNCICISNCEGLGGQIINLTSTLWKLRKKEIDNIFINDTYFDIASPISEKNFKEGKFPDHLFSFLYKYQIFEKYNIQTIHLTIEQVKQIVKNKNFFGETPYILRPFNDKNLGLNEHSLDKYAKKRYSFSSKHNYGVYHNIKHKDKAISFYKEDFNLIEKFKANIKINKNTIFVGIRRGDLVKLGYSSLLKEAKWYIEKIKECIKQNNLKTINILVSTQDQEWYIKNLKPLFDKKWKISVLKGFTNKEPYKYLELIKSCAYFICNSSQFYWIGYLLSNEKNKSYINN